MTEWKEYQERTAEFFRSLGVKAETDVKVPGVRTHHDVDVLVEIDVAGQSIKWIIECKFWQKAVSKVHVLALRTIVDEVGADRGIVLCEKGFQRGALEAANLTNIRVSSLEQLKLESRSTAHRLKLKEYFDQAKLCKERYWNLPKGHRIDHGLRPGLFIPCDYSGDRIIKLSEKLLSEGFRDNFPIITDPYDGYFIGCDLPERFDQIDDLTTFIEELLDNLDKKLSEAERLLPSKDY